jgi:hypothetical protein
MSRSVFTLPVFTAGQFPFYLIRLIAVLCVLQGTLVRNVFGIGPITTVETMGPSNSDDKKMVVATCPPGTIAFSGGGTAIASGFPFDGELAVVWSMSTNNPPTEWVVMAQEVVATDSDWLVEAVAYCADIPGYQKVSGGSLNNSDNGKSINVSCPQGTTMIGGGSGVLSFPSNMVLLTESHPEGNGWATRAYEFTPTADSWLLGVMASCSPTLDLDLEVISAHVGFQSYEDQQVILFCGANRIAIGGGWRISGNTISVGVKHNRNMLPQSWRVSADRLIEPEFVSLRASALCLSIRIFSDGFEFGNTSAWSATMP